MMIMFHDCQVLLFNQNHRNHMKSPRSVAAVAVPSWNWWLPMKHRQDVYAAIHKGGLWLGPRFQAGWLAAD